MASEKKTELSIVLRTVDKATAKIKQINDRLDAITKPTRDFGKALSDLKEKSGLNAVVDGFKGVGSAIGDLLVKISMIGGVAGLAVGALFHLVGEFDDLGDKAERFGVSVDFLAQMRYAAEKAGAPVEALDVGLQSLSQNLGQLRAGTGRMKAFLDKVNPAFEQQLKGAKNNEEAFYALANAMKKLEDPAKRAALAQKTVGDPALAPLLARGGKGVKELAARFSQIAGPMGDAADKAGAVDDSLHDLHASVQGVKAAILSGLAPALNVIVQQLTEWFAGHREDVREFAKQLGEKLPKAFNTLVGGIKDVVGFLEPFFDSSTKIKIALVALVAVMAGPLLAALVQLGIALLANPIGLIIVAVAALAAAWYEVITNWGGVKSFLEGFWNWLGDKIGPLRYVLAAIAAPFYAIPVAIVAAWDHIKDFFVGVWDGVTSAFQAAWDFIKAIVDKIMGAVDKVGDAIGTVKAKIGLGDKFAGSIGASALQQAGLTPQTAVQAAGQMATQATVKVDFTNAPRGTRVTTDPKSTADIDFSMGFQMLPGFGG
jgi:hypothetical protein